MALQLDQQQTAASSVKQQIYGSIYEAQTFQAGLSGELSTVKLYAFRVGSPSNLIVEIQGVSGGKPDGNILASEEILATSIPLPPSAGEITINFSSPTSIVSGTSYSIVVHQKGDGGTYNVDYYSFYGASTDLYVNGNYYWSVNSGSSWTNSGQETFDFYFKTYVETATQELLDINNDFRMILIEPELYDISNDFRTIKITPLDINNDFRFFGLGLYNVDNDFRMTGNIVKLDISNDFRMGDIEGTDINNDFRMVGLIVKGDLDNDFRTRKEVLGDINNKFETVKTEAVDINNKFNNCIEISENVDNIVNWVKQEIKDVNNDFRSKLETRYNINNDFRMVSSWQVPQEGEIGFQSAGKTEIKVYINSAEQTDADIDSLSINQILNGAATASFNLGRPYDGTKPDIESPVEIKYKGILLYKGYITEINPGDSPESIRINCEDEYWKLNKDKKYFLVGRKPADANEFYYETINEALNELGLDYGIGDFIPQTMDLYGSGLSDSISNLVQNSGNFSWFIKPDGTKILWQGGQGNIINLERQELGKNIGLYQVIRHNISENISNIVNKLRVLMGNWTIRKISDDVTTGLGTNSYSFIYPISYETYAVPAWDKDLEKLAKDSSDGYGYDHQDPNKDYSEVFRKFWIPEFESGWTIIEEHTESLTDIYPPLVRVTCGEYWNQRDVYITDGFSIDYGFKAPGYPLGTQNIGRPSVTFSEPQINYFTNFSKEVVRVTPCIVKLYLWKELRWSYTAEDQTNLDQEPVEDINNPLMFYTDKMGSYPETILEDLNLSGLSIQEGFTIKDEEGNIIDQVPSWDDTDFAKDYANWQLSKSYYKKINGSIDLTIDTMIFYNINLSNRIKIEGIVDPINITSINYNFNNFTASLNLELYSYYKRSESIPYRGE